MSEFKELIFKLRKDPESIQRIYDYVKSDPVEVSQMPDETYIVKDGNHRSNLLNLLNVENIPSILNGNYELIDINKLRRPNGSIGTQGFTSENMIKLIQHIFKNKPSSPSGELAEISLIDKKIIKSFYPKDTLSQKIFNKVDGDYKMIDEIRKQMINTTDMFIESLGVEFFIHDIVLTGSLANYNWSEYSDVDLHIIIDFKETDHNEKLLKEFFDSKRYMWNSSHNITIKNYEVELYVQDLSEEHISSGVYSVLNNKWIVEPKKEVQSIDKRKILEKTEEFSDEIDKLINKAESGIDVRTDIDQLKSKLKRFRQSGLERGGEYSYENLTFKLLRRNGYIEKLLSLKQTLIDKKLSLKQ